jgi:hypothetical protein
MQGAVAARSPYGGMITQMPGDALRASSPHDHPQATRTAACLSSSEDRSDCGLARAARESRPGPIDTRKRKESRASIHRTLSTVQCPTLSASFSQHTRLETIADFR